LKSDAIRHDPGIELNGTNNEARSTNRNGGSRQALNRKDGYHRLRHAKDYADWR
jgi:hypothetical protein